MSWKWARTTKTTSDGGEIHGKAAHKYRKTIRKRPKQGHVKRVLSRYTSLRNHSSLWPATTNVTSCEWVITLYSVTNFPRDHCARSLSRRAHLCGRATVSEWLGRLGHASERDRRTAEWPPNKLGENYTDRPNDNNNNPLDGQQYQKFSSIAAKISQRLGVFLVVSAYMRAPINS